jgi:hypothetical protein
MWHIMALNTLHYPQTLHHFTEYAAFVKVAREPNRIHHVLFSWHDAYPKQTLV